MTPLQVVVAPFAVRQIRRLPAHIGPRVAAAIRVVAEDPTAGKALKGDLAGYRSIRVGDYRVVYGVRYDAGRIEVVRVGHRREVYR